MRPKRRHLAIAALVCALIIAWILGTSQRAAGPVQDGRHLSEWVLLLSPTATRQSSLEEVSAAQEAPKAIRALGTNALPYLIQAIAIDETSSHFRGAAQWLMTRLPSLRRIDPVRQLVYGYSNLELRRADGALGAFKILGPTAAPAIPALTQLANSNINWSTTRTAIDALEAIGPPAQSALVGIIETNRNPAARAMAIDCLQPGEHGRSALPALTNALQHADTRQQAGYAIRRITAPPSLQVP